VEPSVESSLSAADTTQIQRTSATLPADASPVPAGPEPFANVAILSVDRVIEEALARNRTVAQMVAAAQAAAARYPQVASLDDPMFGATMAPASIGSSNVNFAYRLEASQRLPYPGKRELRGAVALAEARAAEQDVEDARLTLIESARAAFYDYF